MKKRNIKYILLVVLLIIIDQLFKFLVVEFLPNNNLIIIDNFLKLSYLANHGAALGILSGNTVLLIFISIVLIWYIIREIKTNNNKLYIISLFLVLSGAFGNLIDRVFRGYVVDYIVFTLFNKEMPIFNFADMMITFGILILLYIIIKGGKYDKENK